MVDRDPLDYWTEGRVTLIGDAAHPMYPIGSNGASQGILDARVLSGCIRSHRNDPDRALAIYEAHRRPATSAIVLANRGLGPEMPMRLVHERAPEGFDHINDVISPEEILEVTNGYRRTAGRARSSFKRHVPYRRQLCRNAAVTVTSLPAYRPEGFPLFISPRRPQLGGHKV